MTSPSKILWSEGVTLRPQQFQQQDCYHDARLHRLATAMHPYIWGVRLIRWNEEALANGILRAEAMSLLFQDGEMYDAPGTDVLPAPLDLATLPADEQAFTFYAALPLFAAHGGNMAGMEKPGTHARFMQTDFDTPDLYGDAFDSPVTYLTKQAVLISHLAPRSSYVSFPVITLRRVASGGFAIDPTFVAPALTLSAAYPLQRQLDGLMQKLRAKIEELSAHQREPTKGVVVIQSGDASTFWLMHTVSAAYTGLTHYTNCQKYHPERFFRELLGVVGGLMAFSKRHHIGEVPAYDHLQPAPGFTTLFAMIGELVDTVISSKYLAIPLRHDASRPSHYEGTLPVDVDPLTQFCLGISAAMPALELVAVVPNRFKVGAPEDVARMIASALPGIELTHMPQVPATVPVRPNTYYFAFNGKSALHANMLAASAVTLYVPAGIAELKVEMFAILP